MLKLFSSIRLFFALCLALGAVLIFQTIFNSGAPVYSSAWFAALGALFAVNIAACSLRRAGTAPVYSILLHSGLWLIILGAFATRFSRFEARVPLRSGTETRTAYRGDSACELPFSVKLENFRLEHYGGRRGEFDRPGAPGAGEFNAAIKNFTSSLLVKPADGPEIRAEVSVNKPLKIRGYTLYQAGYDPSDPGYSLLGVTRDRGVWVVYAGFITLLAGIILWLR